LNVRGWKIKGIRLWNGGLVEKKKEIQPRKKDRVSWGKVKKADPNAGGEKSCQSRFPLLVMAG
jgi:hypothetical protein